MCECVTLNNLTSFITCHLQRGSNLTCCKLLQTPPRYLTFTFKNLKEIAYIRPIEKSGFIESIFEKKSKVNKNEHFNFDSIK